MSSDLSFNIVALDKAGTTFLKLAEQVDKLSEKLERLDGKDVTADVHVRTDDSKKALDSFTTRYQLMAAGIAAASPAIGAAIIGGVGAGFIGVAAVAQSSNSQVQESYKGLWQDVVATTRNSTQQLVPAFVGAANQMDSAVQQLGPQIAQAFSSAGPAINALTRGVTDAATNAMPGLTTAMQNSLPVMEGAAGLMDQMGTAGGQALADLSQHSQQLGVDLESFGSIVSSALGTVVSIVGDIADAWAANAGSINGAISGIASTLTGLAHGVLPIFSSALGAAATVVDGLAAVLTPLSPILGFVGGAALATWAAFKLSSLATVGVKSLATGIVNLGGNMEAAAAKSGAMIAGMRGVTVASSTTAAAVTAAGRATATAAVSMGAALSAVAGPLGIALTVGATLWGLFASSEDDAAQSSIGAAAGIDAVTSALQASHGVVNQSVQDTIKGLQGYDKAAAGAALFGITQVELNRAITEGGPKLEQIRSRIEAYAKGIDGSTIEGKTQLAIINQTLAAIDGLAGQYDKGSAAAEANAKVNERVAQGTVANDRYWGAAAGTAQALGIALSSVTGGYINIVATGAAASNSVQDVSAAFLRGALGIAQAQQAIVDHFKSADQAVVTASQGLADANHSAAASSRSVADASHSLANARRSLADATAGVTTAQNAYTRAQEQEKAAQDALHDAREQAIRDLKELHLQLADQEVSEQQARVRLFDVTKDAAGLGVTAANAQKVAMQEVTAENEPQVKAALDLLGAQNALNNTLSSGEKLRSDVAAADKAGVDGAKGVVAAQKAVVNAHEQVISAQNGLVKAQQQVADAAYGVQRAQQAVSDAEYQRARASDRVTQAQKTLKDAQEAASRSLDLGTKAGQDNLNMLLTLWAAIGATGLPVQQQFKMMIDNTANALGLSTAAAQQYLTNLGLIPKDFKYSVTAVAGADLQEITKTTINGVPIFQSSLGSGGIASAGRLASGGPVVGPGGPRDDMVPLWGSHGEFMQPADSVSHYGLGFMEAVRTKKLRVMGGDGAAVPGYAKGGLIEAFAAYANLSSAYVTDVNALTVMGMPHPPQLPKYVPPVAPSIPAGGIVGFKAGAGVQQWAGLVLQALAMLGQPSSLLPNVLRRMNQESGGNPNAINLWDCLPVRTKILTQRGWLRWDEVRIGDRTIGFNPQTGRSEWTAITRVVHYKNADTVRVGNKRWAVEATPNHRWLVERRDAGFRMERTDALHSRSSIVLAVEADTGEGLPITIREAALLGWIAGDGHVESGRRGASISISQSKQAEFPAIEDALTGLPHSRYAYPDRTACVTWRLTPQYSRELMALVGHPKDDAVNIVLAMSAEQRAAWLDAMIRAEGTSQGNHVRLYQCDGPVAEAIDIAIYLSGHRPSRSKLVGKDQWAPCWSIGVTRPRLSPYNRVVQPSGQQDVWCVTTELGTWTAEQDGQIFLTGNSNAKKGTPSIGLMQTIQPTFNRWAGPFLSRGIYDPMANIYAGLNYAIHRYPSLQYAMDKPGGYRNGGWLMPGKLAYNETSRPEGFLDADDSAALKSLLKTGGHRTVVKNYNLTTVTQAHQIDVGRQFARLEALAGI